MTYNNPVLSFRIVQLRNKANIEQFEVADKQSHQIYQSMQLWRKMILALRICVIEVCGQMSKGNAYIVRCQPARDCQGLPGIARWDHGRPVARTCLSQS